MKVIVVGAGPSGLVLSLLLANAGIEVILLDAAATIDNRPRAAHYAPSAIRELNRAGVLEEVREQGFIPQDVCWRKIDGSQIERLNDISQAYNPDALTVLPLNMLGELLLKHVVAHNNIQVKWNHRVLSVSSNETSATTEVALEGGTMIQVTADYICGCDGANSQVRKSLFAESYPGKTWHAQIIATNVYYPFDKFGYDDMNFIIHPQDYYMAARITRDGLWRVSYGEDTNLNYEQVLANQPIKFERMLPGHPKPADYKLLSVGPYRIHQRCAPSFRVGRVLLAADAAHLCNPFGGLGLTGGLVDVGCLFDCLYGIAKGYADDSILDKYSEIRREKYFSVIDPISSSNFVRVSDTDPMTAAEKDEWLVLCAKANSDPQVKKDVDQSAYDVCYDFTQYYNTSQTNGMSIPSNRVLVEA